MTPSDITTLKRAITAAADLPDTIVCWLPPQAAPCRVLAIEDLDGVLHAHIGHGTCLELADRGLDQFALVTRLAMSA